MNRRAPEWIWPLIALAVILAYDWLFTPGFFHVSLLRGHLYGSLIDVFNRGVPVMLLAVGMTLVIATGGVDLSVGAVMAIAGSIVALGVSKWGWSVPDIFAATAAAGIALGCFNGFLVAILDVQPIVATLILMVSGRGIAQLMTDGNIVPFHSPTLEMVGSGFALGVPVPTVVAVGASILVALCARRTSVGSFIEATGDNAEASRFAGVDVRSVKMLVYAVCGLCAAAAGFILTADTKAADANTAGLYLELDAILAVVIGGTKLSGGKFNVFGSFVGALIIQTVTTTILTKGVRVELTLVVKAIAVILVCLMQSEKSRQKLAFWRRAAA